MAAPGFHLRRGGGGALFLSDVLFLRLLRWKRDSSLLIRFPAPMAGSIRATNLRLLYGEDWFVNFSGIFPTKL